MSFGHLLRVRREQLGIGQQQLAARLGVTQQTVSRWERTDALPPPAQLTAIAAALETAPSALLRAVGYGLDDAPPSGAADLVAHLDALGDDDLLLLAVEAISEVRRRGS